jgi:hypothetical protein
MTGKSFEHNLASLTPFSSAKISYNSGLCIYIRHFRGCKHGNISNPEDE